MLLGVVLGFAFIAETQRLLRARPEAQLGSLRGADATRGILIVAIMTLHSVTEGIAVGVSSGGGLTLGLFITIAIGGGVVNRAGRRPRRWLDASGFKVSVKEVDNIQPIKARYGIGRRSG